MKTRPPPEDKHVVQDTAVKMGEDDDGSDLDDGGG